MVDEQPPSTPADQLDTIKQIVFGRPIATQSSEVMLLSKKLALPVFCSDAISSVAYGGQQILLALCLAGFYLPQSAPIYNQCTLTITGLIVAVLVMVALSYWQTIHAYPNGSGSYIVTKDNLGANFGLVAGAAILIDYVLCVAVSVASGMQNLRDVPLLQSWHISEHMVAYCLAVIVFMTFLNLRGLREPGKFFAIPVYTFIFMCYVMIALGFLGESFGYKFHMEYANQVMPKEMNIAPAAVASIFILFRAFATGCSALTGVECVSDGIPAFKPPKAHNAAIVLVWMAVILGTIFAGISSLAVKFHIVYWENGGITAPAVIDQLSGTVFGKAGSLGWAYTLTQFSTALILMVAAQTAYADFPRVCSLLSRDSYMPRQLSNLGDRLAFDNGIWILGFVSSFFIIFKKGSVDLLIPFFTIGVFLAFTLSQSGMVKHWFVKRSPRWQVKAMINGLGALSTFLVLMDIVVEKFIDGAWFVIVMLAVLLFIFHKIHGHYAEVRKLLRLGPPGEQPIQMDTKVVILVQSLHAGTLKCIEYARSISKDCLAVYVEIEPQWTPLLEENWRKYVPDIPLVKLPSPYRSLIKPIMHYLDELHAKDPNVTINVIVGEFISDRWWHGLLHGNTGLLLKLAFLARRDVIVTNVRYWLHNDPCHLDAPSRT
jgi:amino acid transporter